MRDWGAGMSDVWGPVIDADLEERRLRVTKGIAQGRARSAARRAERAARAARKVQHRGGARGWLLRVSEAWHVAR